MPDLSTALTLTTEQQFSLRVFTEQIRIASDSQKEYICMELMRQLMLKDNVVKCMVKHILETKLA